MRIKKVVDSRTAEGRALLESAACNIGSNLYAVYDRFSRTKDQAFLDVYRMYLHDRGTDFRITSANNFYFSVAWNGTTEHGEHYTRFVTHKYDYWIF